MTNIIETNDFNTAITEELFNSLNQEVREEFMEIVSSIEFIRRIISPNIKRACDLERDNKGKIIIDVTEPHKLEDMDYFRPSALHFIKTGRYTDFRPSKNPNSPFRKWISEERRRCYDGYVRESDGEWITGDYYFFLNYCPMMLIKKDEEAGISVMSLDFPQVMDGQYYFFHYIWQARINNQMSCCLASRGRGKSSMCSGMLAKRIELGETSLARKHISSMVIASDKKFLVGANTILNRFQTYIDHIAKSTQWPSRRIRNTENNLRWEIGYMNNDGTKGGVQNIVMGMSAGDDPGKPRGSRASLYIIEEFGSFPKLKELYENLLPSVKNGAEAYGQMVLIGCVCAGTKVWKSNGEIINIEDLKQEDGIVGYTDDKPILTNSIIDIFPVEGITKEPINKLINPATKPCYRITLKNGNVLECSDDHPILIQKAHTHRINNTNSRTIEYEEYFEFAKNLKVGNRVCECREISIFGNEQLFDARLVGMLIGDGCYRYDSTPCFSNEDIELLNYVKEKYEWSYSGGHITKKNKKYEEIRVKNICHYLREIEIYGQTKDKKRLPNNYQKLDRENTILLLSGLYDTDGCVYSNGLKSCINLTQSNKEILEQVKLLWRKFGVICSITKTNPVIKDGRKDKNPWYTLVIAGALNLKRVTEILNLLVKHKKEKLIEINKYYKNAENRYENIWLNDKYIVSKISNIEYIGEKTVYNLSAGLSHTYLANNIITHNTAGDKDSDFEGAKELFYNPIGHDIYGVNNVWDKAAQGRSYIAFFYPAYLNTKGFYDKDGNSDVTGALLHFLKERYIKKYNSDDPMTLVKFCAENPITPEESMMKTARSFFPVAELNERIKQLENDEGAFDEVEVGELFFKDNGTVDFKHTRDLPIRFFPHSDNKIRGAVEIFNRPVIEEGENRPKAGRYICSLDPIDKDNADTMSLSSTFVFDLYTDTIVAEYTGRRDLAIENYEITRMLCHYYNAQCYFENNLLGFKSYMQSKNDLVQYVAKTPNNLKTQGIAPRESLTTSNYGIRTTSPIIDQMNLLIRDWLTEEVPAEDAEGNEIKTKNLYLVKNIALLKELVMYNDKGNFDRCRSFGLLMIGRDECLMRTGGVYSEEEQYNDYKEDNFVKQCLFGGNRKYKREKEYTYTPLSRGEINSILKRETNLKIYRRE